VQFCSYIPFYTLPSLFFYLTTLIFISFTSIKLSFLHFGQNKGKFLNSVFSLTQSRVLLPHIGHSIVSCFIFITISYDFTPPITILYMFSRVLLASSSPNHSDWLLRKHNRLQALMFLSTVMLLWQITLHS